MVWASLLFLQSASSYYSVGCVDPFAYSSSLNLKLRSGIKRAVVQQGLMVKPEENPLNYANFSSSSILKFRDSKSQQIELSLHYKKSARFWFSGSSQNFSPNEFPFTKPSLSSFSQIK